MATGLVEFYKTHPLRPKFLQKAAHLKDQEDPEKAEADVDAHIQKREKGEQQVPGPAKNFGEKTHKVNKDQTSILG